MAAVTIADLRTRVRAIVATHSGIGTDVTTGIALAAVPAYEVTSGGATRVLSGRRAVVTRTLRIWVYALEIVDVTNEAEVRSAFVTAEALIDPIADLLAENPTLKDATTTLVTGLTAPTDNGVGLLHYEQKIYAGFEIEFTVNVGR